MEEITKSCSEKEYTKDTVLFRQGEKAECMYILKKGTVIQLHRIFKLFELKKVLFF